MTRRPPACGAIAGAVAAVLAVAAVQAHAAKEIPLTRDGGVYRVAVTLNGRLVRRFIVDSGAADVQLPVDVFLALFPRGAPSPEFLPGGSYQLADGRVVESRRFMLRSLRIGNHEFPQVPASIGEARSPLLLGQNVLGRLGAWSIDNHRRMLVLGERGRDAAGTGCLSWRTAPPGCAVAAARDYFRDARPRHDVTSLVLLRGDGARATVLADLIRGDGATRARLCGPIELRRAGTGWRVAGAPTLRQIARDGRCLR